MNELLANMKIVVPEAPDISQPLVFTTATASINMKHYDQVLAVLLITDAGTACDVTMKQGSTSTASTALAFTKYFYIADVTAGTALTEGTATSNTFATGTASKTGLYIVPITADMLDKTAEGEDSYVRMNCASTANATGVVFYIAGKPRYAGGATDMPSVA